MFYNEGYTNNIPSVSPNNNNYYYSNNMANNNNNNNNMEMKKWVARF